MAGAIRVAIVGMGAEAQWWQRQLEVVPHTQIVVHAGQGPESGPLPQERWRHTLVGPEVDVVCVCVPVDRRADLAIAALEAGKHVLVPVPVATDWESAQRMADVARKRGVLMHAALPDRYRPAVARIHPWITTGTIGNPLVLVCRAVDPAGRESASAKVVALEMLLARAAGVASWLMGGFTAAIGLDSPAGDTATAIFSGPAGQAAWVEGSLADHVSEFVIEVTGREGYVSAWSDAAGHERAALGLRNPAAPFRETVLESVRPDTYGVREWEEFVIAIRSDKRHLGLGEALESMRLFLAARRSVRTGVAEVA